MLERLRQALEDIATIFVLSAKVRAAACTLLFPFVILILGLLLPEIRTNSAYDVLTNSVLEGVRRLLALIALLCWIRLGYYVARTYQKEQMRLYRL